MNPKLPSGQTMVLLPFRVKISMYVLIRAIAIATVFYARMIQARRCCKMTEPPGK